MKKLITLCLLISSLLFGGITAEAQNKITRKKAKARTSSVSGQKVFGPSLIFKKINSAWQINPNLIRDLKKIGFTEYGTNYGGQYLETSDGTEIECAVTILSKDGITLEYLVPMDKSYYMSGVRLLLSKDNQKGFLQNAKKMGFKGDIREGFIILEGDSAGCCLITEDETGNLFCETFF